MTVGKLVIVKLPWTISSSVSDLRVEIIENGDTYISAEAAVLPEEGKMEKALEYRRVLLVFAAGQWVKTEPAYDDRHIFPPGRFEEAEQKRFDFLSLEGRREYRKEWVNSGICPDSRIYTVENSLWLRETNAERFGCHHYVLKGLDMWVELLAKSIQWQIQGPSTAKVIYTDELKSKREA